MADRSIFNSTGGAASAQGQSASAFGFAVLAGLGAAFAQIGAFALLKDRLPKLYQPKSFLVSERQRVSPLPPGPWQWVLPTFKISNDELLQKAGLDAFFLCRYLILMMKVLGPPALIFIPVLLPLNYLGGNNIAANLIDTGRNRTQGLDILTMANIRPEEYDRLWAHLLLAIGLVIWTCYVIVTELRYFIKVRQTYLTSPQHRLRASASTVLVQGLPKKYTDAEVLAELFDVYPGGIRNIWVNRDYSKLTDMIEERKEIALELEEAESELIQKCWKAHLKKQKGLESKKTSETNTSAAQLDGTSGDDILIEAKSGDGLSFNNPGQVHHTVDDAVDAINRGEDVAEPDLATKKNVLGRGIDVMAHGVLGLGRGIGQGIDQLGKGIVGEEGNRRPLGGLRRIVSRRGRSKAMPRDTPDEATYELARPSTSRETRPSHEMEKNESLPFDNLYDRDSNVEARWKNFIEEKDRPTMRVKTRLKWLPGIINPGAVKVDTIYHCRRELARLNSLIEDRQKPKWENHFPKMNSAFIQFNNQAAAHMACQSVAHHTPTFMVPRIVEITPGDVIWGNLSMPGWHRYIRKGVIFLICLGLMIAWTPLITVFSSLAQLDALRKTTSWLAWLQSWPNAFISVIQGILPPALIGLFVFLLGLILRLLVKHAGAPTRMLVELSVQKYYFVFTFLQYFVVVSVANAISIVVHQLEVAINGNFDAFLIPQILQANIPKSSNYFLSNIFIQSFAQSGSGLLQPGPLFLFIVTRIGNPIARKKFSNRTKLENPNWGTQYPQYTTFACIAIIYSVQSPLILPLTFVGFGVWWASTRYQMLYIYQYTVDTGGLLFPTAVKQLFTGIYVLELFLLGFFIVAATAAPPGETKWGIVYAVIIGIVVLGTFVFQRVIKSSFDELWRYLPITLEDDAVRRDEEFARLLAVKHSTKDEKDMMQEAAEGGPEDHDDVDSADDEKRHHSKNSDVEAQKDTPKIIVPEPVDNEETAAPEATPRVIENDSLPPHHLQTLRKFHPKNIGLHHEGKRTSWADRGRRSPMYNSSSRRSSTHPSAHLSQPVAAEPLKDHLEALPDNPEPTVTETTEPLAQTKSQPAGAFVPIAMAGDLLNKAIAKPVNLINPDEAAVKAQHSAFAREAEELYGNIPDDLEDLTPAERDILLSRAFKHEALRAKRPCIWLPRDELGVCDDEVRNTAKFSKWIWISNEKQVLNERGRCVYLGPPPDFDQVDLIQL